MEKGKEAGRKEEEDKKEMEDEGGRGNEIRRNEIM